MSGIAECSGIKEWSLPGKGSESSGGEIDVYVSKYTPLKNSLIKYVIWNLRKIECSFQKKSTFKWNVCTKIFQVSRTEKGIQADGRGNDRQRY